MLAVLTLAVMAPAAFADPPVFEPHVDYDSGPFNGSGALLSARLNSDRLADLGVGLRPAGSWDAFSLLRGQGDGQFRIPALRFSPMVVGPSVTAADMNGDHNNDIVFGTPEGVSVVLRAAHSFEQGVTCNVRGHSIGSQNSGVVVAHLGGRPGPEAVIPFNGDSNQGVILLRRLAEGGCGNVRISTTRGPTGVAGGDLDDDGRTDVVVTTQNAPASVLFGRSDGLLAPETNVMLGPADGLGGDTPATGDLNADGRDDIVASMRTRPTGGPVETHLAVVLSGPRRTFSEPRLYPTGIVNDPSIFFHISNLVVGDFTGEGIPDVAGTPGGGGARIAIYPGLGDGTLGDRFDYPLPFDPRRLVAGDFNGDGRLDLAARHADTAQGGDVAVMLRAEP